MAGRSAIRRALSRTSDEIAPKLQMQPLPAAADLSLAQRLAWPGFVLDLAAGELLDGAGRPTALRAQALKVLLVLGERVGQVVAKDELMRRVWGDVVVTEDSLVQAVGDIRRVLDDHAHQRVRTVARRGYLLVPPDGEAAGPPAARTGLSLVAMPWQVDDGPVELQRWADRMLDELTTELGRNADIAVVAADVARRHAGPALDAASVRRELGVRWALRGRVRPQSGQVCLDMTLVDLNDAVQHGTARFAASTELPAYEREDLCRRIARFVFLAASRSPQASDSAEGLAHRAVALLLRAFDRRNLLEACVLARRAVEQDSACRLGWGTLVVLHHHGALNEWLPDRGAAYRVIEEASQQLDHLDPDSLDGCQARAILALVRQDWPAALQLTELCLQRHPHPAAMGGRALVLMQCGRADEAVGLLEHAIRLSPDDYFRAERQYRMALACFVLGRLDEACAWATQAQAANSALPWPPIHAAALCELQRIDEAQRVFDDFARRHPGFACDSVQRRLPGVHPQFVRARERLAACLESLGAR
jgi:DNA-binding winged helix-turn-helix (wHTH) protein/TolB-like protein